MKTIRLLTMTLASCVLTGAVQAQAQTLPSPKALVVTADNLSAAEAQGARAGDPNVLRPGDVVRYRLTFTNTTPDSVRNVQFNDPVPVGLRYVAGSAKADRPDVLVEFSIDGGRTYSILPEIEEMVNGQKVRRPAAPESYTHVRWSARGWVQPKSRIGTEFKVQMPTAVAAARTDR